jgi:hypothetical protein
MTHVYFAIALVFFITCVNVLVVYRSARTIVYCLVIISRERKEKESKEILTFDYLKMFESLHSLQLIRYRRLLGHPIARFLSTIGRIPPYEAVEAL